MALLISYWSNVTLLMSLVTIYKNDKTLSIMSLGSSILKTLRSNKLWSNNEPNSFRFWNFKAVGYW